MTRIENVRKFLMNWVLAPSGIRIACYVLSKCIRRSSTIVQYNRSSSRLYVLGNGPSLKKDLEKYGDEMMAYDRLAVNFMGTTKEYQIIRPTCYVLADPIFFVNPSDLPESSSEKVAALQDVFLNKTTWPMTIVSLGAKHDSPLMKELRSNPNITVLHASNSVPVPPDIKDFGGWSRNRYSPPAQNVINMALYLGIVWRYPEIYLLGADTSFHTMVHVEQETNRLYLEDEHFYGIEKRYMYKDPEQKIPDTMSNFFLNVGRAFAWYEKLREFADWAGVRIINASSFSWIDAFERPAVSRCNDSVTDMSGAACEKGV